MRLRIGLPQHLLLILLVALIVTLAAPVDAASGEAASPETSSTEPPTTEPPTTEPPTAEPPSTNTPAPANMATTHSGAVRPDILSLWNFADPAESEQRFRAALVAASGDERLELLTQIARTLGLRQRFDEAHQLLDEVEPQLKTAGAVPRLRYLLERGRAFRSSGQPDKARPLFVSAWELGEQVGNEDLAIDALHMIGIVDGGEHGIEWNLKALPLARAAKDPRARRWTASLLNNLGWESRQLGRHEQALEYFQESVPAYQARGEPANVRIARWQVARTLRDLHRHDEALGILYQLESELTAAKLTDGEVFEEIAENLEAQGVVDAARPYFSKAYKELAADDSVAKNEPKRLARLSEKSQVKSQSQ